jgi:hypothetical protein
VPGSRASGPQYLEGFGSLDGIWYIVPPTLAVSLMDRDLRVSLADYTKQKPQLDLQFPNRLKIISRSRPLLYPLTLAI